MFRSRSQIIRRAGRLFCCYYWWFCGVYIYGQRDGWIDVFFSFPSLSHPLQTNQQLWTTDSSAHGVKSKRSKISCHPYACVNVFVRSTDNSWFPANLSVCVSVRPYPHPHPIPGNIEIFKFIISKMFPSAFLWTVSQKHGTESVKMGKRQHAWKYEYPVKWEGVKDPSPCSVSLSLLYYYVWQMPVDFEPTLFVPLAHTTLLACFLSASTIVHTIYTH